MDERQEVDKFLQTEERSDEAGAPVTFESSEPDLVDMPDRRKRCDESWRPGDPGFRIHE